MPRKEIFGKINFCENGQNSQNSRTFLSAKVSPFKVFDDDVWEKFMLFYHQKIEFMKFQCHVCLEVCKPSAVLISCDHCLRKYHHACGKCKKDATIELDNAFIRFQLLV